MIESVFLTKEQNSISDKNI